MPAEPPYPRRHALGVDQRRAAAEHDVEADAPHAGLVEFIELALEAVGRGDGDAEIGGTKLFERVRHASVVETIDARLDQHAARHAKRVMELAIGRNRGFGRRIATPGRQRIAVIGAKDMSVTIDRARRDGEFRRARVRIGRFAGCCHGRPAII